MNASPQPDSHTDSQTELAWPRTKHSRTVLRGGISWHVQIAGSGPAMLLVHGTGASSHSFRALMTILAHRFTVIAPDLPGHAFTVAPAWFEPSPSIIAAALEELLVALDLTPEIAVGHSAGAAIIARMTLDGGLKPKLLVGLGAALVPFQGVAGAMFPPAARLLSAASRLVDFRVRGTSTVERVLRGTGSTLDAAGVEIYRRLSERPAHVSGVLAMMSRWDLGSIFDELPSLDVPFLLLAGERDRAVPVLQQSAAAGKIPGATLVVIEGAGHLLHEEKPAVVADAILEAANAAAPFTATNASGNTPKNATEKNASDNAPEINAPENAPGKNASDNARGNAMTERERT